MIEQQVGGHHVRHLFARRVFRRQGARLAADRFPPSSACIAPPATSWASIRPRSRRAWRCRTRPGRSPNPMSASPCKARSGCKILDQPERLARGGRVPQGQRLPGHLHRPEAGARHRPDVEPNPPRRRGRDRRPAAGRARPLAAPCRTSSSACRSGLSWLAWAAGCPVVLISGFTHPTNEFATPYRVINWHACNSCWNDPRHRFDHKDFLWCPRHAGTPRQFECTRLITADAGETGHPDHSGFRRASGRGGQGGGAILTFRPSRSSRRVADVKAALFAAEECRKWPHFLGEGQYQDIQPTPLE